MHLEGDFEKLNLVIKLRNFLLKCLDCPLFILFCFLFYFLLFAWNTMNTMNHNVYSLLYLFLTWDAMNTMYQYIYDRLIDLLFNIIYVYFRCTFNFYLFSVSGIITVYILYFKKQLLIFGL